jgi:hypothetical protein
MRWKKPSGLEIETNDHPDTIAYCESVGWKPVKVVKKAVKKAVKRKK